MIRVFGPAADVIGRVLASKVERFFATNQANVINRATEMVLAAGEEPRTVPLRLMVPVLDGASREDNSEMQERWAALLANASLSSEIDGLPPVFASILSNLTPMAARALELLSNARHPRTEMASLYAEPDITIREFTDLLFPTTPTSPGVVRMLTGEDAAREARGSAIAGILVREGLASERPVLIPSGVIARGEGQSYSLGVPHLRATDLGRQFLEAVTPPVPRDHTPSPQ